MSADAKRKALVLSDENNTNDSNDEKENQQNKKAKSLIASESKRDIVPAGPKRTSKLDSPIMLLQGHEGMVMTSKFNPAGTYIASAGYDKQIFMWEVYGECRNFGVMKGHKGTVLDLQWAKDGTQLYSASSDKTAAVWDVEQGQRIRMLRDHTSFVNTVSPAKFGDPLFITGSDDRTIKLWDGRVRSCQNSLQHDFPITAVALGHDNTHVYGGGIDNDIHVWDLRTQQKIYSLTGHQDTITGLKISPDGNYILSNAMDHSLRMFDIRPYVSDPNHRLVKIFVGAMHDMQKSLLRCAWSADGTRVSCGSSDRLVYVWDVLSQRILYRLPGHSGSVNEVDYHPNEPILLSCSNDKNLFLGEIEP